MTKQIQNVKTIWSIFNYAFYGALYKCAVQIQIFVRKP
jgi:hypothetical protein